MGTTIQQQQPLDDDQQNYEWPVCMRMFAKLDDLIPMCEEVGFVDVSLIDAESPMEQTFDTDIYDDDNPERYQIHGKYYIDQYKYLEDMNMDELCKIVTVYGRKPI